MFKLVLPVLLSTILLTGGSGPSQAFIFGKDDRVPLPAHLSELKYKIGFLHDGLTRYGCTASCISKDTILTAAHCVLRRHPLQKKGVSRFLTFYLPSKDRVGDHDFAAATHVEDFIPRNVITGVGSRSVFTGKSTQDWAFIKLRSNACKHGALPLKSIPLRQIAKATKKGKLMLVGFHGDRDFGKKLLYSNKCSLKGGTTRRTTKSIKHTCDLRPGASGSPLLMGSGPSLSIVGLNVAELSTRRYLRRGKKIVKYFRRKPAYNLAVHPSQFMHRYDQAIRIKPATGRYTVELIQKGLKRKKLYGGKIDGVFGPATWRAIRRYQQVTKQAVLGIPTDELVRELRSGGFLDNNKKKVAKTALVRPRPKPGKILQRQWPGETIEARYVANMKRYRERMKKVVAFAKEWERKHPNAGPVVTIPAEPTAEDLARRREKKKARTAAILKMYRERMKKVVAFSKEWERNNPNAGPVVTIPPKTKVKIQKKTPPYLWKEQRRKRILDNHRAKIVHLEKVLRDMATSPKR